jgi:NADPH2:quinone reductase
LRAAWYDRQGPAREVLALGEVPSPHPGEGEVRIAVRCSGVNPGDVKKRSDVFGVGMPFPRIIPHSDGSGIVDAVGAGVSPDWMQRRVWCFGAQSYRPFGTAAEHVTVPVDQVAPLPDVASYEAGACLGIPGLTAHRAVTVAGDVRERTVLVQGGAGAVGACAVAIGRYRGARVLATVRNESDETVARNAGAEAVVRTDGRSPDETVARIRELATDGVDHVVEVAFHANVALDERVLKQGGSLATYATGNPEPTLPFWPMVFKNLRVFFLGSDDFPREAKREAATDLTAMLESGWQVAAAVRSYPLDGIAEAHESVESGGAAGRVVLGIA